jgi:hypothetical protein
VFDCVTCIIATPPWVPYKVCLHGLNEDQYVSGTLKQGGNWEYGAVAMEMRRLLTFVLPVEQIFLFSYQYLDIINVFIGLIFFNVIDFCYIVLNRGQRQCHIY